MEGGSCVTTQVYKCGYPLSLYKCVFFVVVVAQLLARWAWDQKAEGSSLFHYMMTSWLSHSLGSVVTEGKGEVLQEMSFKSKLGKKKE